MKFGFEWPLGVAIDDEDDIVAMVDEYAHCVHVIDLRTNDLSILFTLGEKGLTGSDNQRFHFPLFLAFLSTSQKRGLYITDRDNQRIQYYHRDSRGIYQYNNTIFVVDGFKPHGISVNNHIIAVTVEKSETQSQINIYDTNSHSYLKSVGSTLNMNYPAGVLLIPISSMQPHSSNNNNNNHDDEEGYNVIVATPAENRILIIDGNNDDVVHIIGESAKGDREHRDAEDQVEESLEKVVDQAEDYQNDDPQNEEYGDEEDQDEVDEDEQYKFYPHDLAIDTTNDAKILAVTDYYKHNIKYFSLLTYQYVGQLDSGEPISGSKECYRPVGIDISDKYMILSEYGEYSHYRIQLLRKRLSMG
jgi:hypothetical protein